MYSDEWLKLGYSSSEQIQVSDVAFYRIWHDEVGNEVGVTVDFETANDYHYELPISEWNRFIRQILKVHTPDGVTSAFRQYFLKNKGLFDFESDLSRYSIVYQKIFF